MNLTLHGGGNIITQRRIISSVFKIQEFNYTYIMRHALKVKILIQEIWV